MSFIQQRNSFGRHTELRTFLSIFNMFSVELMSMATLFQDLYCWKGMAICFNIYGYVVSTCLTLFTVEDYGQIVSACLLLKRTYWATPFPYCFETPLLNHKYPTWRRRHKRWSQGRKFISKGQIMPYPMGQRQQFNLPQYRSSGVTPVYAAPYNESTQMQKSWHLVQCLQKLSTGTVIGWATGRRNQEIAVERQIKVYRVSAVDQQIDQFWVVVLSFHQQHHRTCVF